MTAVATDTVTRIAELSDSAFAAFCEDIAGMFGVDMRCDRRQAQTMAVRNLREHFKKLTVVHLTKADGALNGTFQLIFDQAGLFVLSGVVVMLPESRIIEEAKRGSIEDATIMQDAAREVGNLLIGSWDRIFREDCPGHQHFVKTSTFLGKPWDKPEQIELHANAEAVVVLYEMAIEPYPSFTCAAVFPHAVLSRFGESERPAEQDKPDGSGKSGGIDKANGASAKPVQTQAPAVPQSPPVPAAGEEPVAGAASGSEPSEKPAPRQIPHEPEPAAERENPSPGAAEAAVKPAEDRASPPPQIQDRSGGLIPPGHRRPAIDTGMLPSELASVESGGAPRASGFAFLDAAYVQSQPQSGLTEFLNMSAAEIMDKELVWASPEDTVQDIIAKMQQHNVGYVLIGVNGVLEGLVSGSNILGAVSLYLRPMFAKWRRPQDDATLGVKVKWIMSRPVRTVRPDATLAGMIESMRRCGGRCLPVVDAKGAVQGIVTVFDILLRILELDKSVSWKGRPPQVPALMI